MQRMVEGTLAVEEEHADDMAGLLAGLPAYIFSQCDTVQTTCSLVHLLAKIGAENLARRTGPLSK